jgi:photosystem II stability/assembly factor-like uncharacterized protein
MKRAQWNHVMAWTTVFAVFGTARVWAGTNAWTSIGPQGGEIEALSVDPHNPRTLYAATRYGGAFKSLDEGASWMKSGVPNKPLVFDPQDPDTIYAIDSAPWDDGVFKSTDGGKTWNPANSGLPAHVQAVALAIDPLKPSTLYMGTSEGIFKSTDGGNNWSGANSGLPLYNPFPGEPGTPRPPVVGSLVIDPQDPSTLYAVAEGNTTFSGTGLIVHAAGGLVKSTDGGGSWNTLDLGLPQSYTISAVLAIDPQNPSTLYVGSVYGIFKSTDGGAGWSPVNSGLPPFATGLPPFPIGSPYFLGVSIDPQRPDTVYARINIFPDTRVFKTTNGGASWSDAGSGLPDGTFVSSLQIDPQIMTTLYAGTDAGVFKSKDGGTSWAAINSGPTATLITDVAIDPRNSSTLYAAVTGDRLVKTTDGGTNWSPASSGLAWVGSPLTIDPQKTSTVFVPGCADAGRAVGSCGVFKSADGGASWSLSWKEGDSYSAWTTTIAINPQDSNTIYVTTQKYECTQETLRKSVDGGLTWTDSLFKDLGVPATCVVALVIDPQTPANLYAAFRYGGVFKSTNAGATWKAANSGLKAANCCLSPWPEDSPSYVALAIDPGSPGTVYTVSSSGVFKTSDGGMSWKPASSGLPDWSSKFGEFCCFYARLVVDPQNSARVYLGISVDTVDNVFQSRDAGVSWKDSGASSWFGGLAISSQGPSTVYAGSPGHGVFAMTFPPEP